MDCQEWLKEVPRNPKGISDQRKLAGAVIPILVFEREAHLTLSRVSAPAVRERFKLCDEGEPQGDSRPAPEPP